MMSDNEPTADDTSPFAAVERIRGAFMALDGGIADIADDVDALARLRLLTDDLLRDIGGVRGTIDNAITGLVEPYESVTVLDGAKVLTVTEKKSGGSTHWNHRATIHAAWRAAIERAGGDVDDALDVIADCLGKSAAWKSTALSGLEVPSRSLKTTTATGSGWTVSITNRAILSGTPPSDG
jgi:hypothetical protein